jgi:hypothetical protein
MIGCGNVGCAVGAVVCNHVDSIGILRIVQVVARLYGPTNAALFVVGWNDDRKRAQRADLTVIPRSAARQGNDSQKPVVGDNDARNQKSEETANPQQVGKLSVEHVLRPQSEKPKPLEDFDLGLETGK